MDIPRILTKIRPGAAWNMADMEKGYDGLIWLDKSSEKPTLKEIEAAWPEVQAEIAHEQATKEKEALIQAKMREMAIDKLVEEGALTADEKVELVSAAVTK